jgi:hypothetical protein
LRGGIACFIVVEVDWICAGIITETEDMGWTCALVSLMRGRIT